MGVLFLTFGVVAALVMAVLHIVGTVVLVELAGAIRPVEVVAFTGTEAESDQNSE